MSKSALKMSKDSGVNYSTIRRWIKKGYFGEIKTDKNGRYVFPDNMPLPYKSNGKVERDTTLLKNLIDASDLGRIVHKEMFPKIDVARPLCATMAKMHRACQDNYVTQNGKVRRLTPRECARLQGFDDSFVIPVSDSQAYKQFGNAVTVNVAYQVAQSAKETLVRLKEWNEK